MSRSGEEVPILYHLPPFTLINTYVYMCVYVCMYIYIYIYTYICVCVCACACARLSSHIFSVLILLSFYSLFTHYW